MRRFSPALALLAGGLLVLLTTSARADRSEAQKLVQEAFAAVKAGKEADGLRLADRAVRADPGYGEAYCARGIAHLWLKKSREAADDLAQGARLGAGAANYQGYLAQALCDTKRWHEALEAAEAAVRGVPQWGVGYHTRARARLELGEIDGAIEDWTKALSLQDIGYHYMRARAYLAQGEWDKCAADCAKWAEHDDPSDRCFALFTRCVASVLAEKYADAQADADKMRKELPTCFGGHVGLAYLHALARDPKYFDPAKALEILAGLPPDLRTVRTANAQALAYAAAENYPAALAELSFHQDHPDWEAAALQALCRWRLGDAAGARTALAEALRLNRYLPRHLERNRVLGPLAALLSRAEKTVQAESAAGGRRELDLERAGFPLVAGLIEALAHQYRFADAAREYREWQERLSSPLHKEEVEHRARTLEALAGAMGKVIRGINDKSVGDVKIKAGEVETQVVGARDDGFDYSFAQGSGKGLWVAFRPKELTDLILRVKPAPAEIFALARFGLERALDKDATALLQRAVEQDASLKAERDRLIATKRGMEVPESGFVVHQNAFVTPEEKKRLDKGEVLFRGEWMPKKDRDQIAAGKIKVGGKWVTIDEKKLTLLGYRKLQGKWLTPEEYRAATRSWTNAAQESTPHWTVRTNLGPEFARELADAAEAAHAEMKAFFGREPQIPAGARMTILAFQDYGDFRDYCRETKNEDKLGLRGFVIADVPTAVTYDLAADLGETMRSAMHEAARLWILRAFPGASFPDWLLEGLAGQFEGFAWNGKTYEFPRVAPGARVLAKQATLAKLLFPTERLTRLGRVEAAGLGPRDAALFSAQSWALVYFLDRGPDPGYQGVLQKAIGAAAEGKAADFAGLLGPKAGKIDAELAAFLAGM